MLPAVGVAIAAVWAVELVQILFLDTVTLSGEVVVARDASSANPCRSTDVPDIRTGTVMQLRSPSGQAIGITQLRIGHPTQDGLECIYRFTFRNVPPGLKVYGIEVGRRATVPASSLQFREGMNVYLG
jgi:hypothetical protein